MTAIKILLCTFCTFALSGSARGANSPRFPHPIVFSSSVSPESYSGFFVLCSERQIRDFVHCSGIGCRLIKNLLWHSGTLGTLDQPSSVSGNSILVLFPPVFRRIYVNYPEYFPGALFVVIETIVPKDKNSIRYFSKKNPSKSP